MQGAAAVVEKFSFHMSHNDETCHTSRRVDVRMLSTPMGWLYAERNNDDSYSHTQNAYMLYYNCLCI